MIAGFLERMATVLPDAAFIFSSTTFPTEFSDIEGLGEKTIYERQCFNILNEQFPEVNLIYSDRASTRATQADGGWSGSPRIDYPLKDKWKISRVKVNRADNKNAAVKHAAYNKAAKAIVNDETWENNLNIWGMEEISASAKTYHITHAAHATAVRINIHLYRQLHYNLGYGESVDTDDDWVD